MRFDGPGKPPLVRSNVIEMPKRERQKVKKVAAAETEPHVDGSSRNPPGVKISEILEILKKAHQRKKKKVAGSKAYQEAVKKYQQALLMEEAEEQIGQTLDLKA